MLHTSLAAAVALSALSLSTLACATTQTATLGRPAAAEDPSAPLCRVTAPPRVVASRVFVPGGVAATVRDGLFAIRFSPSASQCQTLDAGSPAGPFVPTSGSAVCQPAPSQPMASSGDETMLAAEFYDDAQLSHVVLGVTTFDSPGMFRRASLRAMGRIVPHVFEPPPGGPPGGASSPGLAALGDDRFLLLWLQGDSQASVLRAQPIAGWGNAVGSPLDLSPSEVSVIGRPSAAVTPSGEGLVAFLASNGHGFDVLATPIACATNSALDARAAAPPRGAVAKR
ncbi:MAG TPA: hypothetical protein VEK07_07920 [Polyangiaceae bacterium]|nr:hypothetical protein [Polyangiaceae bacterium]